MKTKRSNKTKILRLCFCALLMAIVCVCTMVAIPLPIGFFNLGDAACILSAHLLGPFLGVIAAAIGSALADILLGYAVYAPATALIKGAVAATAYLIFVALGAGRSRSGWWLTLRACVSAAVGEVLMIGGYFAYDAFVLGYGMGALSGVLGNVLQGACAIVLSSAVTVLLHRVPRLVKMREHLFDGA